MWRENVESSSLQQSLTLLISDYTEKQKKQHIDNFL